MKSVSVSIIVVTFNSLKHIGQSLTALQHDLESVGGDKREIIVFDNNSNDMTVAYIAEKFPNVQLIKSPKNVGFGKAVNLAAKQAAGDYLFLANPDMILDNGALERLLKTFDDYPDVAGVSGRMRYPDGSFQATCRKLPTMYNMFLSRGSWFSRFFKKSNYTLDDFESISSVPAVAGTCFLIRKKIFDQVSGFDERFFMFMEDTDLSLRLNQTGKRLYFNPHAGAVHYWGEGSQSSRSQRLYHHHLSVWKYYLKHFPNGFSLLIIPIILFINLGIKIVAGSVNNKED